MSALTQGAAREMKPFRPVFFLPVRYLFGILMVGMETGLTPKQKQILDWIESYLNARQTMPSRREIASGLGLSSPATIQQHIEALEKKGYLKRGTGRESRALQWTARSKKLFSSQSSSSSPGEDSVEIPLLGTIAAGLPIEVFPDPRIERVPLQIFSATSTAPTPGDFYMLSVRGDSMMGDGILPGDLVILRRTRDARSGETVAALVNGEATLKRLMRKKGVIELHPANPAYPVISVQPIDRFEIQGVLVGLIRRYP